ncbi:MAG: hypothetical protein QF681_11550 [Vicinamibacterales bacterium]|jgi:hypothetical protein|nr:hypothetical protein [Vicinamibacterales bacterium]
MMDLLTAARKILRTPCADERMAEGRTLREDEDAALTVFAATAGFEQVDHPSKLQADDIAHMVKAVLEMHARGFTTELTVFATNPVD